MYNFPAHLRKQQSSNMSVQLTNVLLDVVQLLARQGQCFSEHSRAQHLELLCRRGEERYQPLLELRRQPLVGKDRHEKEQVDGKQLIM